MQCYFVPSDEKQQDMSLSISTNGNASITVSVEVNGTIYSGLCGGGVLRYISLRNSNNVGSTSICLASLYCSVCTTCDFYLSEYIGNFLYLKM